MFRKLGMFDRSLGMFQPPGSIPFQPGQLFAAGEQGVWYDPTDFSTMFQDSAGTTPVTAIEQPVGRILDKSGRGNTATQPTASSRPVLRNLYNLFQRTEEFTVTATWATVTLGTGVAPVRTADAGTDPLGGNTADRLQLSRVGTATTDRSGVQQSVTGVTAQTVYICSVWLKSYSGATQKVVLLPNFGSGTGTEVTVTNTWQRFSVSANTLAGTSARLDIALGFITSAETAADILVWGASLLPNNESSLPYQRVVTNTLGTGVYDTDLSKFKPYLFFDGTDDCLFTGAVDFSATDAMSVFAGIRKLSDAKQQPVVELSATIASNNGTFLLSAPNSAAANYNFSSKGTSQVDNTVTTYTAPITNVVTGLADISTPVNTIRVNGTATTVTTSQGTGNYGAAYPLYIGRRNNADASLIWNGRIYSLIIRGALTSGTQLINTETWVNNKTGAY